MSKGKALHGTEPAQAAGLTQVLLAYLQTHVLGLPRTCIFLFIGIYRFFQGPWGKIVHMSFVK